MTEHDWWSNLSPFEKSRIRIEERAADKKEKELEALNKKKGWVKTKERLQLEIFGHRFMRQQLVNRGIQRARLGLKPILTMKDKAIRHMDNLDSPRTA